MSTEFVITPLAGEGDGAQLLAELTHDFASSLDIGDTLDHAIARFMHHMQAEAASIFLLEDDGRALVCRECAGPVDIKGLRLAPDQGIVGQTVLHDEAKIVRDVSKHPDFSGAVDKDTGFETRSILCVPLSVRGTCIGALELLNKRSGDGLFELSDMQFASTVAAAAALAIRNARMAQDLVEQERVQKELELARQIQESLLPDVPQMNEYPVSGLNIPAREVSGDFFDFRLLEDGRIYFSCADVSGKGMNAALMMAKTTSLLRCLAKNCDSAGELLRQVNEEVAATATMGMFVTLTAGYLHPESSTINLANAGHQAALLRDIDGSFEKFPAAAPPLGVAAGLEFPDTNLTLGTGSLYLYTDGLSESRSPQGGQLDESGVMTLIDQVYDKTRAERLNALVEHWGQAGYESHDDVTLVLVESVA
ncbi:MAG: GAF domain-containing SpoIIE family protein phosphatase [Pseudomonadota bacterium]